MTSSLNMDTETGLLHVIEVTPKGEGIYTTRAAPVESLLYNVEELPMSALSTAQLAELCYRCCAASHPETESWYSIGQYETAKLQICTGCRVARFCSRPCQAEAWKRYHRLECKIFAKLHPKVLPESVRAVMRFILQQKKGILSGDVWQTVMRLTSHIDGIRSTGGDDWLNINLMAKACSYYSGGEDVETSLLLLCILKINGMTLQSTFGDPIGVFLDPFLAKLNHSCDGGNVLIHRPLCTNFVGWTGRGSERQAMIQLLPLREMVQGEELTITYLDIQDHVRRRRSELQKDYLFTCHCRRCICEAAMEEDELHRSGFVSSPSQRVQAEWRETAEMLVKQLNSSGRTTDSRTAAIIPAMKMTVTPPPGTIPTNQLSSLLKSIESHATFSLADDNTMNPSRDPYPRIVQEIKHAHAANQSHSLALACAVKQYLIINPLLYPATSFHMHPTRVVNAVYLLRLMSFLDHDTRGMSTAAGAEREERRKLEDVGLSQAGLRYWRRRVCEEMQQVLGRSKGAAAEDWKQLFDREMENLRMQEQHVGGEVKDEVKNQAEGEMKRLLAYKDEDWQYIVEKKILE